VLAAGTAEIHSWEGADARLCVCPTRASPCNPRWSSLHIVLAKLSSAFVNMGVTFCWQMLVVAYPQDQYLLLRARQPMWTHTLVSHHLLSQHCRWTKKITKRILADHRDRPLHVFHCFSKLYKKGEAAVKVGLSVTTMIM
jgi:hypothetical protein